jgi:methyltransferase (TIGR00027 family)
MALGERGRNPLRARSTAEGAVALRAAGALERDPAVRCPDHMAAGFLGGVNVTTLAKHRLTRSLFLRVANRMVPGAYASELARVKFIDELTLREADAGLGELVLLGAGLDSRPYRLADRLQGVRVFEVDHPATQATKRERLCRLLGEEPSGVCFVPVDFARQELATELARAGHDEGAATLFIWCGVTAYLSEEAVMAVLSWVAGHTCPRTSVVFDAVWASVLGGQSNRYGARELTKYVAAIKEQLRWGITDGQVDQTLERVGLRAERVLGEEALASYVTRTDGSLLDRPSTLGVLVHARVVLRSAEADGGGRSRHRSLY